MGIERLSGPWRWAALKRTLRQMDVQLMVDPMMILTVLQALEVADMPDELALVEQAAREQLYASVLDSWVSGGYGQSIKAISLAKQLREPEALPKAWRARIPKLENEYHRLALTAKLAELDQDWPLLETTARESVSRYPTHYYFYWLLGQALHEQGRDREAVKPLRIYVKYSHDEPHFYTATQWLETLDGELEQVQEKPVETATDRAPGH